MRRILAFAILALGCAATLVFTGARAQQSLFSVRSELVDLLLDQISTPGSFEVTVERVEEPSDEVTTLVGIAVSDGEGVWLTVERATLDWIPEALSLGQVAIRSLEIDGVTVTRPPSAEAEAPELKPIEAEEEETGLFDWPRAPLTVLLGSLSLTNVDIAEGVIGPPIRFNLTGLALDRGDVQEAKIDITRIDDVAGTINFYMKRDFAADTFRLKLDAQEEAGGLVAALAGFPPDSASRLVLDADGPVTDWAATFTASADEVFAAEGKAILDAGTDFAVEADFAITPGPQLDPDARILIGEGARLDIKLAETEPGLFEVERGIITSPALSLDATGQLAVSRGASNLDVKLEALAPLSALLPGAEFERFAFDGAVKGPSWALEAAGRMELDGLATDPADAAALRLETRFSKVGERLRLRVSGTGTGMRLDRIGPDVIGPAQLTVDATLDGEELTLATASLASENLEFSANGAYHLGTEEGAFRAQLAAPDFAPVAAAYGETVTGAVSADLSTELAPDRLFAAGRVALTAFTSTFADAQALQLTGTVEQTQAGLAFDLSGEGSGLRLDQIGPDILGRTTLAAKGSLAGDLLTLSSAALDSAGMTLSANGRYHLVTEDAALAAKLAAPDIAPIARAYGEAVAGRVDADLTVEKVERTTTAQGTVALGDFATDGIAARSLRIEGKATQTWDALTFDIASEGEGLVLDEIPADLTRALTLTAKGRYEDEALTLERAALDSALLAATVAGRVDLGAGRLAADYTLRTTDLARVAGAYGVALRGALQAEGRAEGPLAAPRLAGDLSLRSAAYEDMSFGDVTLAHDVTLSETPEGRLDLTTTDGPTGPSRIATAFRYAGDTLTLTGMDADALGLTLKGDASIGLAGDPTIDAGLDVSARDLRPVGRFAGLSLAGSATGRVDLSHLDGRQSARANLRARGLNVDGTRIGGADIRLSANDIFGSLALDGTVAATEIAVDEEITLSSANVALRGPLSGLATRVTAEGKRGDAPLRLEAAGRVNAAGETTAIALSELVASLGEDTIRLNAPARLGIGGSVVRARGLDLSLPGDGTLTGDFALLGSHYSGDLVLTGLKLGALSRLADLPVQKGTLDARATFDTRRGQLDARVEGRGLIFEGTRRAVGGMDIDLDATWANRQLDAAAEIRGNFGEPVRATLSAPLVPGRGGLPRVASGGSLDGRINWEGDIGDLWTLVPAYDHVLDGRATIDIAVTGTLRAPVVGGTLELRDGSYQNLTLGTILTDLELDTVLREDGGIGLELSASDGAKGTVTATADLAVTDAGTELDVEANVARAVLVRRDDLSALISGDVAVKGPLTALDVTGALTIDTAELRLVDASAPSVVTLDGIVFKGDPEPEPSSGGDSTVTLDITITSPGRFFVRGRGLESEWQADLAITGDAAAPVVDGRIERLRGQLDFLGETFDLATGRVVFDTGSRIDPGINVVLEAQANGIVGQIIVEGRASDPELRFASTPSLPEDEVLPRLLFGTSKDALSGEQALQLAVGVATLLSGDRGPLDIARDTLGVDTLRLDGLGSESASVTVGKTVAPGVYVGVKEGLGSEEGAVTVEVEVFEGITLDGEVGRGGGSSVGITFRKDF